ncbi:MAG TPA: FkbM family methyltransferase [Candidatus Baltobacteraceae bacterium]|nr:FkbM family methyltransferase [Candidatus Baltobacteraceae bacterium]
MRGPAVYVGSNRVLLWTKNGYKMFVDSRDVSIAPHLILEGVYEEHTDAVLRKLVRPGMNVVEIGANVGLFTLLMCHRAGRDGSVYAFECDPTLAQIARDNLELNGFSRTGTIDERAVSDATGTHEFRATSRHRGGGTLVAGLQQIPELRESERETIVVQTVRFDEFLVQYDRKIDFVKIDAEGAESAIIAGGGRLFGDRGYTVTVMLEFAPRFMRESGMDPAAQLERLRLAGFTFSRIDERRRRLVPTDAPHLLAEEFSDIVLVRA